MYCKKCGNNIPNDASICPNCGIILDEDNIISDKELQEMIFNSTQSSMSKTFNWLFPVGIICLLFLGYNLIVNHGHVISNNKYTAEQNRVIEDVGFVYGFIYANTEGLSDYCSMQGYIPHNYIKSFNQEFYNTKEHSDTILLNELKPKDKKDLDKIMDIYIKSYKPKMNEILDKEYNNVSQQYPGLTRKDYCKIHDMSTKEILNYKKELLKKEKPHIYVE